MNFQKTAFFFILLISFGLSSCKEQKGCTDVLAINFNPDADADDGNCTYPALKLHLHPKVGTEDFSFSQNYMINGVNVNFDMAQFYLTGFDFIEEEATNNYSLEETYLLVKADQNVYDLGLGSKGTVKDINFSLGVKEADNHLDPATFDAGHPLAPQSPSMNWSWANGYKFLRLEGSADTDGDGTFETNFEYHIGGDANLKDILVSGLNQAVNAEEVQLNVKVDYAKFFNNIDLATENITHVMDAPAVAAKLLNNYSDVFTPM